MQSSHPIIVVSGLPRAGTSLLMQMLLAGGVPLLTDGFRQADESNPRGYLEFEKVKYLANDNGWLGEARGKAVKVVVPLIPFLPIGFHYRILFVTRDLDELIHSQARMLTRGNAVVPPSSGLKTAFERALQLAISFAEKHPDTQFQVFQHREIVSNSQESARKISDFLENCHLDLHKMAQVIDLDLYRNRADRIQKSQSPETGQGK